ncbi:MAG: hypothetical protein ACTHLL_05315 [Candidatus Nitrosocosmicus sp.]
MLLLSILCATTTTTTTTTTIYEQSNMEQNNNFLPIAQIMLFKYRGKLSLLVIRVSFFLFV